MDEFEKSVYVLGIRDNERSVIVSFKDDAGKEVGFKLTRNHMKKLCKLFKDFEFGDFLIKVASSDTPEQNQVYGIDGIGNSIS